MDITVTARNFTLTDSVKDHAERRLAKLARYHEGIHDIDCLFVTDKRNAIVVEVNVHARGGRIHAKESDHDLRSALDRVAHKLERLVKRQKSKLQNGHHRPAAVESTTPVVAPCFNDAEEEEVKKRALAGANSNLDSLAIDEAVMRMDHDGEEVLVFNNSETARVNVVYRRSDGAVGLIDSELGAD